MPPLEIAAFSDEHLDEAARLLAARHARHRKTEPTLPEDVDFRAQVEAEWRAEGASGSVGTQDGRLVGYLIGRPVRSQLQVGVAGHAVEGDSELVRDLYAAAAGRWVDEGHKWHAAFVPATDAELVDAWFRLAFGCAATTGAQETSRQPGFDAGVVIRPGTPDDLEAAAQLDRAMGASMVPAPSFSDVFDDDLDARLEEWRDTWDDDQFVHFVAERDGRVVGHILLYRRPHDVRVPRDSIDLAGASTYPELRGSGIGRALTEHVITWAHEQGIPVMTTDWRMTNMFASRFWPRRGFRRTFLRLERLLP